MTSDTKIGLLLGLLFILVIAFLINGLPTFQELNHDGNELITNMASVGSDVPTLGRSERQARQALFPGFAAERPAASNTSWPLNAQQAETEPPRTVMNLPASLADVSHPISAETAVVGDLRESRQLARAVLEQQRVNAAAARQQVYRVQEGDTLAGIAKKLYGPEQGNRRVVVQRLYEANRSTLSSPDRLKVGQRLVIPPIDGQAVVVRAGSFGEPSGATPSSKTRIHEVKDGESLWTIASRYLGDGRRYTEIVELNRDVLGDEDEIAVGMRLRLPR